MPSRVRSSSVASDISTSSATSTDDASFTNGSTRNSTPASTAPSSRATSRSRTPSKTSGISRSSSKPSRSSTRSYTDSDLAKSFTNLRNNLSQDISRDWTKSGGNNYWSLWRDASKVDSIYSSRIPSCSRDPRRDGPASSATIDESISALSNALSDKSFDKLAEASEWDDTIESVRIFRSDWAIHRQQEKSRLRAETAAMTDLSGATSIGAR